MNGPEDPLESLIKQPMHKMSFDQLTEFIKAKRRNQEIARDKKAYFDGTYEPKQITTIFDDL